MPAPINYSSIYEFIHKWHILSIDIVLISRNYTHEKIHIISALTNNFVRNNRHPITIKFERQRTLQWRKYHISRENRKILESVHEKELLNLFLMVDSEFLR